MQISSRRTFGPDTVATGLAFFGMVAIALFIAAGLLRFPAPVVVGIMSLAIIGPLVLWRPFVGLLGFLALMYLRPEQWFPQLENLHLPLLLSTLTLIAWLLQVLRGAETFRWTAHLGWMLAFSTALLLSARQAAGGGRLAITLMDTIRLAALFFVIQQLVNSEARAKFAIHWYLALTTFLAGMAVYGWLSGTGVLLDRGQLRASIHAGNFDDPNDLAAYIVLLVPLALHLTLRPGSWTRRLAAGLAFAVLVGAVVLCNSRGGLIALAVGLVALLSSGMEWKRRLLFLAGVGGVIFLLAHFAPVEEVKSDDSAMGRVAAWSAGLTMFRSSPIFGVGYESFTEHFRILAHDSFVQALAELGLFGALAWVGLYYWGFLNLARVAALREGKEIEGYAGALFCGLLSAVTAGLFLSHTYRPIPLLAVAFSAALGAALLRKREANWPHYLAVPVITVIAIGLVYVAVQGLL